MKIIIAGGRDLWLTKKQFELIDRLHAKLHFTEEVCGCAPGADSCGRIWAWLRGIKVAEFPADWEQFGRMAGPRRNRQMAEYADALLVFPGNAGTANMYRCAKDKNLRIFDATKWPKLPKEVLDLLQAAAGQAARPGVDRGRFLNRGYPRLSSVVG